MKKTAILAIVAVLIFAPFQAFAISDAQILKLRQTCRGTACDAIPQTSAEIKTSLLKEQTITATSSVEKISTKSSVEKKETKKDKELRKKIRKLERQLAELIELYKLLSK